MRRPSSCHSRSPSPMPSRSTSRHPASPASSRPSAPHGGGAFSGKDPTKVDRSGAYAARYVAKNIVAAGLATRCQIQIAYVIGVAKPVSLNVETFGTGTVDDDVIRRLIDEHFDFRPQEIIERFRMRRPIYRQNAKYGHFGRI